MVSRPPTSPGGADIASWPAGMRVITRKKVPHVGAQLRITGIDGRRYTAIATSQAKGQLAVLEVRHRLRAQCEDSIRNAKDTGLANLVLHASSRIQTEIVSGPRTRDIRTETTCVERSELQPHVNTNENYHRRSGHDEYSKPLVSCHCLTAPLSCQGVISSCHWAILIASCMVCL